MRQSNERSNPVSVKSPLNNSTLLSNLQTCFPNLRDVSELTSKPLQECITTIVKASGKPESRKLALEGLSHIWVEKYGVKTSLDQVAKVQNPEMTDATHFVLCCRLIREGNPSEAQVKASNIRDPYFKSAAFAQLAANSLRNGKKDEAKQFSSQITDKSILSTYQQTQKAA